MRRLNTAERALLASRHYNVHAALWIRDPWGKWINLSAYEGVNWFQSAAWEESLDSPVASGSAVLRREVLGKTISPLIRSLVHVDGTVSPFLGPGTHMELRTAVCPPGARRVSWRSVFMGKVDEVDFGGAESEVRIRFRDLGALLLDTKIERIIQYGSSAGLPALFVMNRIIEDNLGFGAPGVRSLGGSPGLLVPTYAQEKRQVLEALRDLALQGGGYDLRQRYDQEGVAAMSITAVDRDSTDVMTTFGPGEWAELEDLKISDAEVRNVIRVLYKEPSGRETSVLRQDDISIRKYGRRYEEIEAPAVSSAAAAVAMAEAMLSDLSQPRAYQSIRVPFFWPAQLGDVYAFQANNKHFNAEQRGAVTSIRHELSNGSGWTTLSTRGRPAAANVEWRRRARTLKLAA